MKKLIAKIFILSFTVFAFAKSNAYMLRDNGPLRTDNGNGGVEWSITVPEGTELELLSETVEIKDLVMSKSTEKDCKFYKVKYSDKIYYALESEVAVGTQFGYIVDDATLFAKPAISSFRNAYLEFGTFVVVGEKTQNMGFNFVEIKFFDTDEKLAKSRYVQENKITTQKEDIETLQLITRAVSENDEEFKKELLSMARNKMSSTIIHSYAEQMYNKILGLSSFSDDDISVLSEELSGVIISDDVRYRSLPGTSGDVLGKFNTDDAGTISLMTNGKETIDEMEDYWYFFTKNETEESGWVYGGFIELE